MFEDLRRGRQARNLSTNVPKILDLKSSSEQLFSAKLTLGPPESSVRDHPNCEEFMVVTLEVHAYIFDVLLFKREK